MTTLECGLVVCLAAACGLISCASGNATVDPAQQQNVAQDEEGPEQIVSDIVEQVSVDRSGTLRVGVRKHAQLYFMDRADPKFDDALRRLQDAHASKRTVRITFRSYSGRILNVTEPREK